MEWFEFRPSRPVVSDQWQVLQQHAGEEGADIGQ